MKLPEIFKDAVASDPSLSATLNFAIDACEPIISNRPEFFPEYTDHGPNHNTEVLNTAVGILSDGAITTISSADYVALALSVLLHDCGMHLTGDSFVELISPTNRKLTRLDTHTWRELWDEFLLEAKRFDGRQLKRLFGTVEPVSEPPTDPADFRLKHKLLVGEFLRRNHPRLAHEISIFGFPTAEGTRIPVLREGAGDLAEISGLIARSHGISMRQACQIFAEHYHVREFQGIHPPIIMAALRIADYLQVQPERAPKSALKIRKLRSQFSAGEWRVHQCVRNITSAGDDPEAIFVDAAPESVATFLKFKNWAESFQAELDSTWAALGEAYGRFSDQGFDKFQLRLRRLRTSIDNEGAFSESCSFLPAKISFEASSPDLLGLLVAPLYGNRPEIGLRELIQNSIDAVIEREHIEGTRPTEKLFGHDVDVVVRPMVEGDKVTGVVIEDRGIGMNADVVQNYFLKAGASFRSSSQWKKSFISEEGGSEVARTGRFGVGALAGFLLGSSIEVETRRLGDAKGLRFNAELENEAIEVMRCDRPTGTKISIRVDEQKLKRVSMMFDATADDSGDLWDWYCLNHPSLLRIDNEGNEIKPDFIFNDSKLWVSIDVPNYRDIKWGHYKSDSTNYFWTPPSSIYVNGIYLSEGPFFDDDTPEVINDPRVSRNISITSPTVMITDNDGYLPINLQRDGLSETDKVLEESLRVSLTRDLVAQAIAWAPEHDPFHEKGLRQIRNRSLNAQYSRRGHPYSSRALDWCWEDQGWRLADAHLAMHKPYLLVLHNFNCLDFLKNDPELLKDVSIVWQTVGASGASFNDVLEFFRSFIKQDYWERSRNMGKNYHLPMQQVHSKAVFNKLMSGAIPKYLEKYMSENCIENGGYVSLTTGGVDHPVLSVLSKELTKILNDSFLYTFTAGENKFISDDDSLLKVVWSELCGDASIPPNFSQRKSTFEKAFSELGDRIDYYRTFLKKVGSR